MEEKIIIHACLFKRSKYSVFERGVRIGEGGAIVDLNGNIVENIYDCHSCFENGCFVMFKK